MKNLTAIDFIALIVLIVGGVNWGMVGLLNVDLVSSVFGVMTMFTRVIYSLVGLSAFYSIYILSTKTQ
jgi:uncharacterized membrane protein YuzA (DUF378 family)